MARKDAGLAGLDAAIRSLLKDRGDVRRVSRLAPFTLFLMDHWDWFTERHSTLRLTWDAWALLLKQHGLLDEKGDPYSAETLKRTFARAKGRRAAQGRKASKEAVPAAVPELPEPPAPPSPQPSPPPMPTQPQVAAPVVPARRFRTAGGEKDWTKGNGNG